MVGYVGLVGILVDRGVNNGYCCVVNVVCVVPFFFAAGYVCNICYIGFVDPCDCFDYECLTCSVFHEAYEPGSCVVVVCSACCVYKFNLCWEYVADVYVCCVGSVPCVVDGYGPNNGVIYAIFLFVSCFVDRYVNHWLDIDSCIYCFIQSIRAIYCPSVILEANCVTSCTYGYISDCVCCNVCNNKGKVFAFSFITDYFKTAIVGYIQECDTFR